MVSSSSRPHHSRPFTVGKAGTGTGSVRGGSPGRPGSGAGAGARSYLPPANMPETGISFTEFLEALAWVAVRGMRADGEGEGEGKEAGGGPFEAAFPRFVSDRDICQGACPVDCLGAGQHGCVAGGVGDEERSRFAVFLIERWTKGEGSRHRIQPNRHHQTSQGRERRGEERRGEVVGGT